MFFYYDHIADLWIGACQTTEEILAVSRISKLDCLLKIKLSIGDDRKDCPLIH